MAAAPTAVSPALKPRLAVAAAALVGVAGAASVQAATADAYPVNLTTRSFNYGDCRLTVGMERWAYSVHVRGYGQVSCGQRHDRTQVTVTLKRNGGHESIANSTTFLNSYGMGSRWLLGAWMGGCAQYQAVMNLTATPWAPTYVTTGAPINVCYRSAKDGRRKSAKPRMRATT